MAPVDFAEIERRFTSILDRLGVLLSVAERREVEDFVDVGEYGVALETLSSLLVEERKVFSAETLCEITALAETMGIRESVVTKALEEQAVAK
jgi:hypothetical protein